jgi:hypothetical protein
MTDIDGIKYACYDRHCVYVYWHEAIQICPSADIKHIAQKLFGGFQ